MSRITHSLPLGRLVAAGVALVALAAQAHAQEESGDSPLGSNILDVLDKGGVVMVIIVALSIVGLAFAFERLVALRLGVLVPSDFVKAVRDALAERRIDDVERLAAETNGPLARILAAGLRRRADAARERKLPGDVRRGSTGSVVLVRRRVHGLRRLLRRLRCGVPCRWRRPEHRLHTGLVSKRDARVRERKRVLLRRRVHGLRRLLQQQAERVQLKLRLVGPPRKRPARVDPRCRDGAPPSSR